MVYGIMHLLGETLTRIGQNVKYMLTGQGSMVGANQNNNIMVEGNMHYVVIGRTQSCPDIYICLQRELMVADVSVTNKGIINRRYVIKEIPGYLTVFNKHKKLNLKHTKFGPDILAKLQVCNDGYCVQWGGEHFMSHFIKQRVC